MNLGFGEIAIILFVALLFFGPSKLPELGKAAGVSIIEFKQSVSGLMEDAETDQNGEKNINKNQ